MGEITNLNIIKFAINEDFLNKLRIDFGDGFELTQLGKVVCYIEQNYDLRHQKNGVHRIAAIYEKGTNILKCGNFYANEYKIELLDDANFQEKFERYFK